MAQELDSDDLDRTDNQLLKRRASSIPRGLLALLALASMVGGVAMIWYATSQSELFQGGATQQQGSNQSVSYPAQVLSEEDASEAVAWLKERHGIEAPGSDEVLLAAGGLAIASEDYEKGVRYFDQIKTEIPRLGMTARLEQGVAQLKLNLATPAELNLRKFLEAARVADDPDPTQVLDGFKWLTFLLSVQIRQEERKALLEEQHVIDLADPLDSKQLYFPNLLILNSPAGRTRLAKLLENEPENAALLIASARYQTWAGEFDEAIKSLKQLWQTRANDLAVAAALAEALVESDRLSEAGELIDSIPVYDSNEPWLLTRMRGEVATHREQWPEAIQFYSAVLAVDPANAPAQMGLAVAYEKIGEKEKHQQALQRSSVLAKIRVNLGSVQTDAEAACLDLATQCRAAGMNEAADRFEKHATRIKNQTKIGPPATQQP